MSNSSCENANILSGTSGANNEGVEGEESLKGAVGTTQTVVSECIDESKKNSKPNYTSIKLNDDTSRTVYENKSVANEADEKVDQSAKTQKDEPVIMQLTTDGKVVGVYEISCDGVLRKKPTDSPFVASDTAMSMDASEYVDIMLKMYNHSEHNSDRHDPTNDSVLRYVCKHGYAAALEILLNHGNVDANLQDEEGKSIMIYAVQSSVDTIAKVQLLLNTLSFDLTLCDKEGNNALHHACACSSLEIIKLLIRDGRCNINQKNNLGRTPIMCSATSSIESSDTVLFLLNEEGMDVLSQDTKGDSVLHRACDDGSIAVLEVLLQNGSCDVNLINEDENIPLWYAFRSKIDSKKKVEHLLRHSKIDPKLTDANGDSLLHLCCVDIDITTEFLRILLDDGRCDVNHKNNDGITALMYILFYKDAKYNDKLKLLLDHPAIDINIQDNRGYTVWHHLLDSIEFRTHTVCDVLTFMMNHKMFKVAQPLLSKAGLSALDCVLLSKRLHDPNLNTPEAISCLIDILLSWDGLINASPFTLAIAMTYCSTDICNRIILKSKRIITKGLSNNETIIHCCVLRNSFVKCVNFMQYNAKMDVLWRGLNPLSLAIVNECSSDILELLSKDMKISELRDCIASCSLVDESLHGAIQRLNVQGWSTKLDHVLEEKEDDLVKGGTTERITQKDTWTTTHKKRCSSKLRKRNIEGIGSQSNVCETVKNCRFFIETYTLESDNVTESVMKVINRISELVLETEFSHMAFKMILSGSTRENTKCYSPNEVDLVCVFQNVDDLDINEIQITCLNPKSNWMKLCSRDNVLNPRLVAGAFYRMIEMLLDVLVSSNERFGNLQLFKHSLQLADKISRLHVIWRGEMFDGIVIHVDLVPAFTCFSYESWPSLGLECSEFLSLAKTSRHDYLRDYEYDSQFPLSYCRAEKLVMDGLSVEIKNGYIRAKALRLADICRKGIDFESLGIEQDIACDDYITSYMLKTCLLNLLMRQHEDESQETIAPCMYIWADAIYAELEQCLDMKRLGAWYEDTTYLFDCSECEETLACCKKLKIIFVLTKQIRRWLKEKMAILQQTSN